MQIRFEFQWVFNVINCDFNWILLYSFILNGLKMYIVKEYVG